eukprot:TRINITY_DN4783_c0_g1_i1.p1 TRINITY_DN4783_c0_g1~~TRINITY_DN4783_c0_g1_i1.p1  ORF type:complete len:237 (-),score=53.04 TRINITY_DN4783_c0_g1_i1:179-838(-)
MARNYVPKKVDGVQSTLEAKIVLLGDTGVGKTSIALRFTQDTFQARTNPTIGASFLMKNMQVGENKMKLQIWDTAGQDRFRSLAPMYYRGASAALLVYDLTSASSFAKIKEWVKELRHNVPTDIIMVVVSNKLDRAESHRQLKREVGEEYARSVGASFAEVSAKTKEGIDEVFVEIAEKLLLNRNAVDEPSKTDDTIVLGSTTEAADTDKAIDDSCCGD